MIRVISLGAGVQSTTLALMAAHGELPMPDCAIFADTGWEPKAVYAHLERLKAALPFQVYTVSAGHLREDTIAIDSSKRFRGFAPVPWFHLNTDGSIGLGKRQCTSHYKIEPIHRKIRELHGGKCRKGETELWIGISTNEAVRIKPSRVQYIINRWPLIEKRMNRGDCRAWLEHHGWDAPRSACIGCPFRNDEEWQALTPDEMTDAIVVDEAIRHQRKESQQFAHRSCKPLRDVDFSDHGQADLFNNECEGLCGV